MSSGALGYAGPRWADLSAAWLRDPWRYRVLAWLGVPLLAIGCIAAPLPAAVLLAVTLLFTLFWKRPLVLALLLIALMGNVKINYYAGFFTVFPEYILIVLASLAWVLRWMEGSKRIQEPRLALLCGGLVLAGALSFPSAISLPKVFAKAVLVALAMVIFFLMLEGLPDRRAIRRALVWLEVGTFLMAAYGVLQLVGNMSGFDTGLRGLEKWGNPAMNYGIGAPFAYQLMRRFRVNGFFNDPNILAGYLAAALCVVLALRISHGEETGRRWRAHAESGVLAVLTLCLLLTLSRSGIIAAACGVGAVLWLMPRVLRGMRFWLVAASGTAVAGLVAGRLGVNPLLIFTRLSMAFDQSEFSARQHRELFVYGVDLFRRHPLTGVGLGNFGLYYASQIDAYYPNMMPHNAFLNFFAESGIIGGTLFLALVIAILRRPFRALRDRRLRDDRELFAWNVGLFAALVALNVGNVLYDYYLRTFMWVFGALAVAVARQWELKTAER